MFHIKNGQMVHSALYPKNGVLTDILHFKWGSFKTIHMRACMQLSQGDKRTSNWYCINTGHNRHTKLNMVACSFEIYSNVCYCNIKQVIIIYSLRTCTCVDKAMRRAHIGFVTLLYSSDMNEVAFQQLRVPYKLMLNLCYYW